MIKRIALAFAILLMVAAAAAFVAWNHWNASIERFATTPFGSEDGTERLVDIPRGAGMRRVARLLIEAGVTANDERRLLAVAKSRGFDRRVKAGEFAFKGALSPEAVLDQIAKGRVKLYTCTISEGLRTDEIAALLDKCGYAARAEIDRALKDTALLARAKLTAQGSFEGYLYPDTYAFPKGAKIEAILLKMVERVRAEYARADAQRQNGVTLNEHEVATLASIIEKETGDARERPRIACVFHNRLRKKMMLQTDPTVIYAKLLRYGFFDGNIRRADLEFAHPYNTYTVKGLPPGPIASAGRAALQAALNPMPCDDLFFVACGGGTHKFCPDYECHKDWVDVCQLGKSQKKK
ncbi:MAG: endolytic transglycosylase MltG [Myxococcales bacterium]|jgi:UPF0755 protein|nr:endolytic transglycosylase MltG [Myxococcales bacterium]